jgi:hypothetical protein
LEKTLQRHLSLLSSLRLESPSGYCRIVPRYEQETLMLKYLILGTASLAFAGTAVAADLPKPQPVYQSAPVGKYPVGKYPVGKTPIGKYPAAAPVVTKG